jgi:hypothetical protein
VLPQWARAPFTSQAFAERASSLWAPRHRGGRKESDGGHRLRGAAAGDDYEAALALGSSFSDGASAAAASSSSPSHGPLGLENDLRSLAMAHGGTSGRHKRPLLAAATGGLSDGESDAEAHDTSGSDGPLAPFAHSFGAYDVEGNLPSPAPSQAAVKPKSALRMKKVRLPSVVTLEATAPPEAPAAGDEAASAEAETAAAAVAATMTPLPTDAAAVETGRQRVMAELEAGAGTTAAAFAAAIATAEGAAEAAAAAQEVPGRIVHLYKRLGATVAAAQQVVDRPDPAGQREYPAFLARIDPQVNARLPWMPTPIGRVRIRVRVITIHRIARFIEPYHLNHQLFGHFGFCFVGVVFPNIFFFSAFPSPDSIAALLCACVLPSFLLYPLGGHGRRPLGPELPPRLARRARGFTRRLRGPRPKIARRR